MCPNPILGHNVPFITVIRENNAIVFNPQIVGGFKNAFALVTHSRGYDVHGSPALYYEFGELSTAWGT
jgi:hypothetical protein